MNNHLQQFYGRKEKSRYRYGQPGRNNTLNGFRCAHCQGFVTTEAGISGVRNRNHCPYCLWSRHLDLFAAGDRLSACKALMQPIGLTLKHAWKKYTPDRGELMLIHACKECAALSINRIAADDDSQVLVHIFEASSCLDAQLLSRLETDCIEVLTALDGSAVDAQLFGSESNLAGMLFPTCAAAASFAQEN